MEKYDFLIVGAGLFGSTFAYLAHCAGRSCLVIDKRSVPGGNVYCDLIEDIPVHKYGAHIFHTNNRKVWDFVNSFVTFNRYINAPIANYKGEIYNLPFNMNTFNKLWGIVTPEEAEFRLDEQRKQAIERLKNECVLTPRNLEEQALIMVGTDIYNKLIKGYTEKQWGRPCKELPSFIIRRLPLRLSYDNNYFKDSYQGIPDSKHGYNVLIDSLLSQKNTQLILNEDFFSKPIDYWLGLTNHIVYTGPIDQLFNYEFGELEYRSVRFETQILDKPNYQGNAVVNFTDRDTPYTRIIEHKHFIEFGDDIYLNPKTVISKEYSSEWKKGSEPFYPVNDEKNNQLYEKYKAKADDLRYLTVAGRLGQYRYLDMDKTIESAMKLAETIL